MDKIFHRLETQRKHLEEHKYDLLLKFLKEDIEKLDNWTYINPLSNKNQVCGITDNILPRYEKTIKLKVNGWDCLGDMSNDLNDIKDLIYREYKSNASHVSTFNVTANMPSANEYAIKIVMYKPPNMD
jgi:hypothetical protein